MLGLSRGLWLFWMLVMLGIAWLDHATGKDLVVWALYLLPVALASWMAGIRAGIAFCTIACGLMLASGVLDGHAFSSMTYFFAAVANRTLALLVVAWLASRLHRKQALEATIQSYEETLDYYHVSPPGPDARLAQASEKQTEASNAVS